MQITVYLKTTRKGIEKLLKQKGFNEAASFSISKQPPRKYIYDERYNKDKDLLIAQKKMSVRNRQ